jgi:hypothetical protein
MPTFTSCIKSYDSSAFRVLRRLIFLLSLAILAGAQEPPVVIDERVDKPFPGTEKQAEFILKGRHEKNMKDLERLARLVEAVQADERKNSQYVLSVQSLKNLEQIEKLSRGIRDRMKR